jgi:hypothetical protein
MKGPETSLRGSVSQSLQSRLSLRAINSREGWYQPGYRPAVASDGDLFPLLRTIEQPTQFILGLECADFGQIGSPSSLS